MIDAADAKVGFDGNSSETMFTPGGSPRVLDEPVLAMVVTFSVAYDCDGRIKVSATVLTRDHSFSVVHEQRVPRGYRRCNRGHRDSDLELINAVGDDIDVAGDADDALIFDVVARAVGTSRLWIVPLVHKRVCLSVLEGASHESSIAPIVVKVTIDELLDGELVQLPTIDEVGSFDGSDGSVGPA